jgi:two-component system response regulator YesN
LLTVLVVDDEPFVRVAMASLRDWAGLGYDFRYEAANGQQALAVLTDHPEVDIVLLDLSMPVMDGIQFLKSLPAALEARPGPGMSPAVVVLSAHEDFPLVRKAFHLGVKDYLLKTEVDDRTLGTILDKVAAELTESRKQLGPKTESAQDDARVLLDLLTGPTPDRKSEAAQSIKLPFPATLWRIEIQDFEGLETRLTPEELTRFLDLFLRSIRQLLGRRGGGVAVEIDRDHAAAVTGNYVDISLLGKELKESLERYLSVRIEVLHRSALTGPGDIRAAWEELGQVRQGSSRIVLVTKRYLRENFTRPVIPLDELATHVGVSRNHLSWEFARETGETITDHLARLRVEEACRLLATTTLKVYEIAERVGYTNVEHFGRVFKKVTGTSPNRWAGDGGSKVFRDIRQ